MTRRNQPAAQKRLLVFTIQLEDFDEQILKHLSCGFYFCTVDAFNGINLLPKLTPVLEAHHQRFEADEQVFSQAVELERLVISSRRQRLMLAGGQRQRFFAQGGKGVQFAQQIGNESGGRGIFHGWVAGLTELAVKTALLSAKWRLTVSALPCHWMKLTRQRAMSAMEARPGDALVPISSSHVTIRLYISVAFCGCMRCS